MRAGLNGGDSFTASSSAFQMNYVIDDKTDEQSSFRGRTSTTTENKAPSFRKIRAAYPPKNRKREEVVFPGWKQTSRFTRNTQDGIDGD